MIQPAIAAALLIAQAAPAQPLCVTRGEAADVMAATLPFMVDSLARKCSASLPPDSFLRTGSGALLQRLRAETAERSGPSGRAVAKVFGSDMPEGVSPETITRLFAEGMAGEMAKDVNVKDCAAADRLVAAVAPLPATNIGALVATFFEIGAAGDGDGEPFKICEDRG